MIFKTKYLILLLFLLFMNEVFGQEFSRDSILAILKEAYELDQAPRRSIDSLIRLNESDGNKYLPFIEQQKQNDSINQIKILPIIDYIFKSQVYNLDTFVYNNCWIIIQHAPSYTLYKYKDFIKQLIEKNLISASSYMAYMDRCEVKKSKAQLYGYQHYRFPTGQVIQYPRKVGYEKRWKDLGLTYNESLILPSGYGTKYHCDICIDDTQFVIIGSVIRNSSCDTFENISIFINDKEIEVDSHGIFKSIVNKQDLPLILKFKTANYLQEYVVNGDRETDYYILNCIYDEDNIYISRG